MRERGKRGEKEGEREVRKQRVETRRRGTLCRSTKQTADPKYVLGVLTWEREGVRE